MSLTNEKDANWLAEGRKRDNKTKTTMSNQTPSDYARIDLDDLNKHQKPQYLRQKACSILADIGLLVDSRSNERGEGDFLAQHIEGDETYRVRVRSQLTFAKQYQGEDIYMMFLDDGNWYIYPHDELLNTLSEEGMVVSGDAWENRGEYTSTSLSGAMVERVRRYQISLS